MFVFVRQLVLPIDVPVQFLPLDKRALLDVLDHHMAGHCLVHALQVLARLQYVL